MPDQVDLRSDTLSRPTAGMRAAMAEAEVGDDGYGEDPSVNALEAEVAAQFGMGAAMFVPSGTMSNQVALRLLCAPGGELLCDADAHIVSYEGGGLAAQGGIQTRTMVAPRGLLTPEILGPQLRVPGYHAEATSAVAVEHTHMRGGGAIYPLATLADLRALTTAAGAALHCDGARIWNAHVATGVALEQYGALFDTLSVCLSKGLGAPVGSVLLLRDPDQLERARELRHRLGGAMRQAGILAAAGRYALRYQLDRLADDHRRANRLATEIAEAAPGVVDPTDVQTNVVLLDLTGTGTGTSPDADEIERRCQAQGVLVSCLGRRQVRLVTHLDVDDAGIERASTVIRRALAA